MRRRSRRERPRASSSTTGRTVDADSALVVATDVAADHGIAASDVDVRVLSVGAVRGDDVVVEVEVTMPAIGVSGMSVGRWHYTARAARRIDDLRSR